MRISGAAFITGGASGLGEATARALHARGVRVTIADINADRGASLAGELGLRFVKTNVADHEQVAEAVEVACSEGPLRISVHCAGIGWAERIASTTGAHDPDAFSRVLAVNLVGTFNALRSAGAAMAATEPTDTGERGVMLNTASVAYSDGQIGQVAYSASKGGVVGLTLPAARDLAREGVRVCTIAPGAFETPLAATFAEDKLNALLSNVPFPRRLGRPAEYAALVMHVVENEMLNGEVIRLDGALRMPPR